MHLNLCEPATAREIQCLVTHHPLLSILGVMPPLPSGLATSLLPPPSLV